MAKKLVFLFLVIGCFCAYLFFRSKSFTPGLLNVSDGEVISWQLDGKSFKVKVVTNQASIEKGLGGIKEFVEADGMLFVFPGKTKPIFWMKGMQFAIDLYWIRDGQIIGVEKNILPPESETTDLVKYYSPGEVDMVLEIPVSKNLKFYSE
ncbi:MAG: DUF192 domain-containing protein [Candidatus Pacebacteria bacterium]|nr:DUF192 domain-containing protein [Candidatus Paceibacterota bacterium]